jgi:nickel/cobalt transporter (NicO) family protein
MVPKPLRIVFLALALMLCAPLVNEPPGIARAHPLGELTVNHFSELNFERERVTVRYVIDFAEIPSLEQILLMGAQDAQDLDDADLDAYLNEHAPAWLAGLDLKIDGDPVDLSADSQRAEFSDGNWGFTLLRVEIEASAELPRAIEHETSGRYVVRNFPGRLGWHEVVMPLSDDVMVIETTALRESVSDDLRDYPDIAEQEPLQIYDVEFRLAPGSETDGESAPGAAFEAGDGAIGGLQRLVRSAERLVDLESGSRLAIMLTMIGAFTWGALHALSPGHGKAVVGAYLIGSRGTPRHAIFLGLTVTATHTAGIFALGFVALGLSHIILPETIFPYLSLASGILVIAIGLGIGYRRYRAYRDTGVADDHGHHHHHHHGHDHDHDHRYHHHHHDHGHVHHHDDHGHDHEHHHHEHDHGRDHHHHHHGHGHSHLPPGADGSAVTWRSLLALGVSGGMVPCPSALVLLLGAIALGRLEFGIVLVVLFSIGLAAVLTLIGLLMVYLRSIFERYSFETRAPGVLPVLSSLAIAFAGVIIVLGAVGQTGLL